MWILTDNLGLNITNLNRNTGRYQLVSRSQTAAKDSLGAYAVFFFPDRSPRKLGPMIIHDSLIRQEGGTNTLRCSRSLPGIKLARDLTVHTNTQ